MNNLELCYRCEYRAQYHETGHAPRAQCGDKGAVGSCYMHRPVKPLVLIKENDSLNRPQFSGAMFSSRSRSGGLADCRLNLEQGKDGSVLYWSPKSLDDHHLEAQKALWFMEGHPAIGSPLSSFFDLFDLSINMVCKRGYTDFRKGGVQVFWSKENYKKFKKEFDIEFKSYSPEELKLKSLISIDVPYKTLYGEEWAPDHIEYWGEVSFVAFMGKDFNPKEEIDRRNWQHLSGVEASSPTFEGLIIKIEKEFKKIFGDFSGDDFYTPKEKKNNKGQKLFIDGEKVANGRIMHRNPKYIHLSAGELNRRWWKWFSKTAYCKKQWSQVAKDILAGKDSFSV